MIVAKTIILIVISTVLAWAYIKTWVGLYEGNLEDTLKAWRIMHGMLTLIGLLYLFSR